jgi:hypothetical protein
MSESVIIPEKLFEPLKVIPASFPKSIPMKYVDMFSDVDEFFERYFEATIRIEGFKLYNVLLGAA